jgi:hypothetical protein
LVLLIKLVILKPIAVVIPRNFLQNILSLKLIQNFLIKRDREIESDRDTEIQRDRETERQRDRETERQRDRETERQRDRETERQRDRETERVGLT